MDPINVLLQKYFAGKTSQEELQRIEKWIKNNPREFDHLKQLWQAPEYIPIHNIDVSSGMKTIDEKLEKSSIKTPAYSQLIIKRVVAAAAIIVMLIGTSWFINHQVKTVLITQNDHEKIQNLELSDGSMVVLNKESTIIYPRSFSGRQRKVDLQSGNAFFEVRKNPKKPFIINSPHGKVKVLGTSFNVFVGEDKTEVYVKTGKVELINEKTQSIIQLSSEKVGIIFSHDVVRSKDVSKNYLSWKTDRLEFENAGLQEVMQSLERHYQCKVRYDSKNYPSMQFNGIFESAKLTEVLEVLALACHIDYRIIENEFILYSNQ